MGIIGMYKMTYYDIEMSCSTAWFERYDNKLSVSRNEYTQTM